MCVCVYKRDRGREKERGKEGGGEICACLLLKSINVL